MFGSNLGWKRPKPQAPRGRTLSFELARASAEVDGRREVRTMHWEEINLGQAIWSIPREQTKNDLPHDVPLGDAALEILRSAPHRDGRSFVFGMGQADFRAGAEPRHLSISA